MKSGHFAAPIPFSRNWIRWLFILIILVCLKFFLEAQVVEVKPVFPKLHDDITVTFNAAEGNGALLGVSPVYAHTGVITSASSNGGDWKHVQGNWGTADPHVLMQSIGNNKHTISYNIHDFYGVNAGETVKSLAFVFRNADGSVVGRAGDGADIFYPVYPDNVDFLSVLLSPQQSSLALFEGEVLPVKGATSQDADLYIIDNDDTLSTSFGNYIEYGLSITDPGNHDVSFVAVKGTDTLTESFFYTVIVSVDIEDPPPGRQDGLTLLNDTTAYFQLYAPGKSFVHLIGDLTNWQPRSEYQLKRSVDGNTWWIEITGLIPGARYRYQYVVDGTIRIGDPYSTLILDPFNDGAIDAITFPNKPPYPTGLTTGNVSVFYNAPTTITTTLTPKPAKGDLIIYELLLRDFLQAHSYKALKDTLDYLQRLGVNAVELMPVHEFEGNYGWGYNPDYDMALDKLYGPETAFRALIDECHYRGIAIILDVVFNHAFNQSPFALLYWDSFNNRPAADNPWLNPIPKHDFNVGNDFNHESAATKYFVKRVLSWWLQTYGVDGFRFDLSKGFTQKNTLGNTAAWGHYDQSRINILQDYANLVWSIDPDAYVILEHFADNDEETELSRRGMMLWGNMNYNYAQASMGYGSSDLSWGWYQQRGWADPHLVTYMESHDEERVTYKNKAFGSSGPGYNIKDLPVALRRTEMASVFLFLIPGPKMMWEFGELGYDYPINYCTDGTINNNCRLDPKPIRWDYLTQDTRRRIYDVDRAVIQLRQQVAFQEGTLDISLANQFEKKLHFRHADMDITAAGNFNVFARNIMPGFTRTGWWYDYLGSDSLYVANKDTIISYLPGEYHIYTTRKIDLGFDITTSTQDGQVILRPLVIVPTPSQGWVSISIPDELNSIQRVEVLDITGKEIRSEISLDGPDITLRLNNPMPGMYMVRLVSGRFNYIGKMIVE